MISYVIPVYNEKESLPQLIQEINEISERLKRDYEILFIDDGSTDGSGAILKAARKHTPEIHYIRFRTNFGKSAALQCGFKKAKGDIIVTLDADLQDDPAEVPVLVGKINEGYDLACAWRKDRKDPFLKKIFSQIYNRFTALVSGVRLHDFNCGFKAYRREVLKEIELYGELHRYIPVLAGWRGFKIAEVAVKHRPRVHGKSKYGLRRLYGGAFDLLTAYYITRFRKRPSRFFYGVGTIFLLIGGSIDIYLFALRISGEWIGHRLPAIMAGLLFTLVGIQLICTGLLSEYINTFYHRFQKEYSVEEE